MAKGTPNKHYTPEFKQKVVEAVMKEGLSYKEAQRQFGISGNDRIQSWERIYLTEGPEGLAIEQRGHSSTGRSRKLSKEIEEDLLAEVQRLRGERTPKKFTSLGFGRRATPAQRTQVVQKLRQRHDLKLLLPIAQLPRATFYYHLKRMNGYDKYEETKAGITAIYHENKGRYGYRRITMELHNRRIPLNRKTVQLLMKELGLLCRVRMKKYRSYKGEVGKIAPNLLKRDFSTTTPNQKCVTDVTEFSLFGEKLYLSPILDLHSRDLVNYVISERPVLSEVLNMVDSAASRLPPGATSILHSDQGWQYQHRYYQKKLADYGIIQSMSRKSNCLDNAVIENGYVQDFL